MRTWMLSLFALVVPLGCAVPSNFPSQEELYDEPRDYNRFAVFSHGREVIGGQVNAGGVLGLDVNLGRYTDADDHALRGRVYGRLVDMRIEGDRVRGLASSLPFELAIAREERVVTARGLVYGRNVEVALSDERARVVLGPCELDLGRRGPVYVGRKRCDGRWQPEEVELQVGRGLSTWSDAERLSALSLMLFMD
ncbi:MULTISPECIES: hypothetical protein [Polyangium]|uniref:YceI family protein n=2 Tax=Polyangium TaxID=55 RepID=A0A4U1JBN5_9BACT|nr:MULTISPECIES: hypothetical protein [Polyangium]MDI1432524.1 hypothetical protein [Polyangium sorediatum]TKD05007.1 hypothetical protein E8A74_22335 [Polyangium fumosum]